MNWQSLSAATHRALVQRDTESTDSEPKPAENQGDKHDEEDAGTALESVKTRLVWLNWLQFALSRQRRAD